MEVFESPLNLRASRIFPSRGELFYSFKFTKSHPVPPSGSTVSGTRVRGSSFFTSEGQGGLEQSRNSSASPAETRLVTHLHAKPSFRSVYLVFWFPFSSPVLPPLCPPGRTRSLKRRGTTSHVRGKERNRPSDRGHCDVSEGKTLRESSDGPFSGENVARALPGILGEAVFSHETRGETLRHPPRSRRRGDCFGAV